MKNVVTLALKSHSFKLYIWLSNKLKLIILLQYIFVDSLESKYTGI